MVSPTTFIALDIRDAILKSYLLPLKTDKNDFPISCGHCKFINHVDYHFCTNCGYPVCPNKDNLIVYNLRLNRRKATERMCQARTLMARNSLYVLATILTVGVFYIFSGSRVTVIKGLVMLLLGSIYAGLGWWSLYKPFTSLLIGLMILVTFTAIYSWAELSKGNPGYYLYYTLFIQSIFIYSLWQGTKAAFQSGMLEEESKI